MNTDPFGLDLMRETASIDLLSLAGHQLNMIESKNLRASPELTQVGLPITQM